MQLPAVRIAACLLAPALWLAPLAAQRQNLEQALPAETILYVSMPDIMTSLQDFKSMPLSRMWAEKEVQEFVAGMVKLVEQQIEEGLVQAREAYKSGMLPLDPDELMKLRVHGASFALTGLRLDTSSGEPMPDVGVVAHLDFGSSAPIWQKTIEFVVGMLEEQSGGMLQPVKTVAEGATLWKIHAPDAGPFALHVAFLGQHMLLATREAEFRNALSSLQAPATGNVQTLATSPAYRAVSAHLDSEGVEMKYFLQPQPLIDFLLQALEIGMQMQPDLNVDMEGVHRVIDVLGLRNLHARGSTWRYEGSRCVTKDFTLVPKEARKGLFAAEPALLDKKLLGMVSEDASSFWAFSLQLGAIYDGLVAAFRAYDPQLAEMFMAQMDEMQKSLDLDIRKDLLGALGDQMLYWSKPLASVSGLPPSYALLNVKDEAGLLKSLRTLFDLSEGALSIADVKRGGMQMHQLKVELPGSEMLDIGSLFSPYFAFRDGYMATALSTQDVQRTVNRLSQVTTKEGGDEGQVRTDIRSNPEFAPHRQRLEAANVYSASFVDWKASFEGYYQLTFLLGIAPIPPSVPIDISLLPEVGTLTKHLSGAVSVSTIERDGYLTTSVSPFGPEIYLGIGALAGAAGTLVTGTVQDSPAVRRNR